LNSKTADSADGKNRETESPGDAGGAIRREKSRSLIEVRKSGSWSRARKRSWTIVGIGQQRMAGRGKARQEDDEKVPKIWNLEKNHQSAHPKRVNSSIPPEEYSIRQ
jgi:hypothetical protein